MAGERTEGACHSIIKQQLDENNIHCVRERPFWKALEKGIEKALSLGSKWTLFLDADVLLRSDGIEFIIDEMESKESAEFYMTNFRVLDRGFYGPTYAGVHGYRTEYFAKALQFMEKASKDQRPETRLFKEMRHAGHPTLITKRIVGIHDFEQFHFDLYRKYFVRAFKYQKLIPYMFERFKRSYAEDDESKIMLWGLMEGAATRENQSYAPLDPTYYLEKGRQALSILGINEKEPLGAEWTKQMADEVLENFRPDDLFREYEAPLAPDPEVWRGGTVVPKLENWKKKCKTGLKGLFTRFAF